MRLYIAGQNTSGEQPAYYEAPSGKTGNHIAWARVHASEGEGIHSWGKPITFEFALHVTNPHESLCFSFQAVNNLQQQICSFWFFDPQAPFRREPGTFILRCKIEKFRLYMGSYTLKTWFSSNKLLENLTNICPFDVTMHGINREEIGWQPEECTYLEDAAWEAMPAIPSPLQI